MAEGARLESVYTFIAYRGFESLRHRHKSSPALGGVLVYGDMYAINIGLYVNLIPQKEQNLVTLWLQRIPIFESFID